MKRTLILLAAAALFALPTLAGAAEKKAATQAADAAKAAGAKAVGGVKAIPMYQRVDAIDAKGKTFTTKRKDGVEIKHVITDKTEIMNGEAAAKLSDIKVGEYVSGTRLKKSETEYEVVKITKFGAAKPKAPKPAAEKKTP